MGYLLHYETRGVNFLIHKDHKYVARVDLGDHVYRYFYTEEEYQRYMNASGAERAAEDELDSSAKKSMQNAEDGKTTRHSRNIRGRVRNGNYMKDYKSSGEDIVRDNLK